MTPISPEQIAALRTLLEKATPAPWRVEQATEDGRPLQEWRVFFPPRGGAPWADDVSFLGDAETAELIAALRNAAPALLQAAEERDRLRAALEALREATLVEAAQGDGVSDEMAPAFDEASRLLGLPLSTNGGGS